MVARVALQRHHSLREKILDKFGRRCNNPKCRWLNEDGTMGCTDYRALQIDHVRGGGRKEIDKWGQGAFLFSALHNTTGKYQLLCANCNWIKRFERGETAKKKVSRGNFIMNHRYSGDYQNEST